MKLHHPQTSFQDHRGEIKDILAKERIDFVTTITCEPNSVRGNHFHKLTHQYNYILSGKVKLLTRVPGQKVVATVLNKGDLALTEPMEEHAIVAIERSEVLVLTKGVRGGEDYEEDTYRLDSPLREDA